VRAALYARVSTERQADRGTIGSQLALLREHIAAAGDELVGEYVDDGHSGAQLDRPGLDALRDAAEAGLIERVWCLSPDRLARAYAYQVLVLDELDRFGVTVAFTDSPGLAADDPQAILLTQVQGVIAEYEKAKIAERYRRGKLFRARAGEIVTWKSPYGYRRIPRSDATGQAHHEIYEPEAAVVRRIFTDRAAGISVREICRRLNADAIPSPTGKPTWSTSTICRLLRNEAYIGRVYYNRTESMPDRRPTRRNRQVPRDRDEWIPIECPRVQHPHIDQSPTSTKTTSPPPGVATCQRENDLTLTTHAGVTFQKLPRGQTSQVVDTNDVPCRPQSVRSSFDGGPRSPTSPTFRRAVLTRGQRGQQLQTPKSTRSHRVGPPLLDGDGSQSAVSPQ
jgi:site-specific DNA recombinase